MQFIPKIEKSAIIGSNVNLGDNNYIGHNTIIKGNVIIGDNNYIGSNVVIGETPQHSSKKYELNGYKENRNRIVSIGSSNVIREFTTIHQPMDKITTIGDNCYFMAYNHIPHDAIIDNNVILTNNIQIGGFTHIHKYANIGLSSIIHQSSTIGAYSMVGMGSIVTKDILPFLVVMGAPAKSLRKINEVGMKRNGFTDNEIQLVNSIYLQNRDIDKSLLKNEKIMKEIMFFYNTSRRNCIFANDILNKDVFKRIIKKTNENN